MNSSWYVYHTLSFHLPTKDMEVAPISLTDAPIAGAIEFIGILCIHLLSAKQLARMDVLGSSDPYCILQIGQQTMKSKVIKNNLNPNWNETLMFSWDGISPLIINVMDKDRFKQDDHIGMLNFDISSLYAAGMLQDKEELKMDLRLENTPANGKDGTIQFGLTLNLLI